ncbi:MAG: phosphatidate cytidylyltransferase [Burkholderiaceae bacterium]
MLWQRLVTAMVLLAVLLPTIFVLNPVYWGVVTLVFLATAGWEWRRLQTGKATGYGLVIALLGSGLLWLVLEATGTPATLAAMTGVLYPALLVASLIYWVVAAPLRLRAHRVAGWGPIPVFLILFTCWLSLYALRQTGADALIAALCIVWIADIGAYFVGRAIGRRKLAPDISPGKSWEGAIGGAFLVVVAGLLVAPYPGADNSLPTLLISSWGPLAGIVVLAIMAALSILGDLHESMLKRQAGVKDSGRSLPGHGGVLDRIDALLPTMPAAGLLHLILA